jgi:thymidylate kinase
MSANRGNFITFEGIDGAEKSMRIATLAWMQLRTGEGDR